jgi:hypothetical protein
VSSPWRTSAGAALLLVFGGCTAAPPSASLSPSASGSQSAAPASVAPTVTDDPLFQVTVDRLRLRAAASTGAEIVRVLERGEVVRVVSGPVEGDGYQWYEVLGLDSQVGWVATGDGAVVWLTPIPADPPVSELLLRFQRDGDVTPRTQSEENVFPPDLTVTADGQVVLGWNGVVRQLSDAGMAQIQSEVLELPALQVSAEYLLERLPGSPEPPGHGVAFSQFWLGEGPDQVQVGAVGWLAEEEGVYWVASPERLALDQLAGNLMDIEAWLGPDAWSEPIGRRYVSDSYLFWLWPPADAPPSGEDVPDVSGTAWPFDGDIDEFGDLLGERRCGYLDVGQAFEMLRLMREQGIPTYPFGEGPPQLALDRFGSGNFGIDDAWFGFFLTPRGPDGYPSCTD